MVFRYALKPDKPAASLRWLLRIVLYAADMAVRAGDCDPAKVVAEVRHAVEVLTTWWSGKPRTVVLGERPVWQRAM